MTLLPAAARLLPVVLPEGSIIPEELPGSITEFFRVVSFFAGTAPLLLFISDISPTLGSALEFLNQNEKAPTYRAPKIHVRTDCAHVRLKFTTYRFVIPVFRFVPDAPSAIAELCYFNCRDASPPFLAVLELFPPPILFLNPYLVVFLPTYFLVSSIKLLKSNLFSSSSSCFRLRSSSSLAHRSASWRSRS